MAAEAAKPAPAAEKDPLGPRIAVKNLHFDKERSYPGGGYGSGVTCGGGSPNTKRWNADFLPRVGMFELRYQAPSSLKVETLYIPREWASFEPA